MGAVFGMGDQGGYADNFCDAMDELATCFEKQGATIVGAWPTAGYEHEESKSVRGDNFVGCAFDEDNQPDESEERANKWVEQIKGERSAISRARFFEVIGRQQALFFCALADSRDVELDRGEWTRCTVRSFLSRSTLRFQKCLQWKRWTMR